jgi:hypothetical protein
MTDTPATYLSLTDPGEMLAAVFDCQRAAEHWLDESLNAEHSATYVPGDASTVHTAAAFRAAAESLRSAVELLDRLGLVPGADRFTACGVCGQAPEDSGAQSDQATITWNGVPLKVCSNCVHGCPVSIVDLHKAVRRITPKAAGLHIA